MEATIIPIDMQVHQYLMFFTTLFTNNVSDWARKYYSTHYIKKDHLAPEWWKKCTELLLTCGTKHIQLSHHSWVC